MKYFCLILFLITGSALHAAVAKPWLYAKDTTVRSKADTTDTVVKKMSVSAGVSYGSDVQFFGRTGPITYPFVSSDVIFNTKNGFFVYGSALKVLGYNPFFDEIDLGGGYLFNAKQGLMTEICNSINFNITTKMAIAVTQGYYFFDGTNSSRSTQYMGFSFTYNFLKPHSVNNQRKRAALIKDN